MLAYDDSCLGHCPTSRKIADSNSVCVIGNFLWHNPYGRTVALKSTQSLTEMSNRCISWGLRQSVRTADYLIT